jgi:hypothetical protein
MIEPFLSVVGETEIMALYRLLAAGRQGSGFVTLLCVPGVPNLQTPAFANKIS